MHMQQDLPREGISETPAPPQRRAGSRLLYADPGQELEAWRGALARAASLGLHAVAVPTPFAHGPTRRHVADFTRDARGGPAAATLERLAAETGQHGLGLVLDLALDGLAAGSPAEREGAGAFAVRCPAPRPAPSDPAAARRDRG